MNFLYGCGEKVISYFPLSKMMAGWRMIYKPNSMIDNNDRKEHSNVYKYKRTNSHGILAHVRDKPDKCAFCIVIKSTLNTTLVRFHTFHIF